MNENPRIERIRNLRKAIQQTWLTGVQGFLEEILEVLEDQETRLRLMEKQHEESD